MCHTWMSHVSHLNVIRTHRYHIYAWVVSHGMRYVVHVNEMCACYTTHMSKSHHTCNESCQKHIYMTHYMYMCKRKLVTFMSHMHVTTNHSCTRLIHVTHARHTCNESCHKYSAPCFARQQCLEYGSSWTRTWRRRKHATSSMHSDGKKMENI